MPEKQQPDWIVQNLCIELCPLINSKPVRANASDVKEAIPVEVINKPFRDVVLQGPVAAISCENLLFSEALPHAEPEHTALLLLVQ